MKKKKSIVPAKTSRVEKKKPKFDRQNYIFLIIIVVALFGIIFLIFHTKDAKNNVGTSPLGSVTTGTLDFAEQEIVCAFHRKLDGVCVSTQEEVNPPIIGVMVENALDAQPLSGIAHASIVYEAPVEANIPRFLAIYPLTEKVEEVGPIRSARPYYLDWLSEYGDAMYMHVGGSDDALQKIRSYDLFDINEFFFGKSFWRSSDKFAPHNTYTSTDLWSTTHEKNIEQFKNDQYTPWQYETKTSCTTECIKKIALEFGAYSLQWDYNSEINKYERLQNGRAHKDSSGEQYIFDNIIIQHVNISVLDAVGRKKIITIGEGKAEIFFAGGKIEGTWKKNSRTERTQWFDAAGSEIKLAPGKTWVEVFGV